MSVSNTRSVEDNNDENRSMRDTHYCMKKCGIYAVEADEQPSESNLLRWECRSHDNTWIENTESYCIEVWAE